MMPVSESYVVASQNATAKKHPCLQCELGAPGQKYHGEETYICRHPVAMGGIGCNVGVYHRCRKRPGWCPHMRYGEND